MARSGRILRQARPHNLPAPLTSFIGREADIAALRQLLAEHRLVTLTGAGGVGKTRLAIQVGEEALADFAGRGLFRRTWRPSAMRAWSSRPSPRRSTCTRAAAGRWPTC